ncbi:hypothetical protein KDA_40510 [Dictyobacter alpinus]|uniref:YdhG-like domain-containing protein n=1 Tax=Dictyobacter alpinus TaxID=2014873 RepID=A0A402BBB5_9CHLR|nr:DUF1801 domain-containing protein [Dictyobacter alpinus]GCE28567.1 hypothetical protein KDA_40510 [Dictyobacter alpinus]
MNADVTAYIDAIDRPWQAEICQHLRQVIYQVVPDIEERMQYGKPHYKKKGKYVCLFNAAKSWVGFTIFNAQTLQAPDGFFEPGGSPDRQTIKILAGQTVDYKLVATLLQEAARTL